MECHAKKVKSKGLSKKLDENHPFFRDLCRAHADYLNSSAAILNKNLEFYNSIMYTILKSNQEPIRLKLHVGDIVELNEKSEGIAYAKIEAIIWHQANNGQYYAFFLISFRQQIILILYQGAYFIISRSLKSYVGLNLSN